MLNKKNRIGNPSVIEKLYKKGFLHKDQLLVFKALETKLPESQFALSVSKKISKKAVQRNKLRRQLSEAIRLNLDLLSENYIVLVIAKPSAKDATYANLTASVQKYFKKLGKNAK